MVQTSYLFKGCIHIDVIVSGTLDKLSVVVQTYPQSAALYSVFPTVSCCEDADLLTSLPAVWNIYIIQII